MNIIKKVRTDKSITQSQLAQLARISRPHLNEIENGKAEPSVTVAIRIAYALDCCVETIFFAD